MKLPLARSPPTAMETKSGVHVPILGLLSLPAHFLGSYDLGSSCLASPATPSQSTSFASLLLPLTQRGRPQGRCGILKYAYRYSSLWWSLIFLPLNMDRISRFASKEENMAEMTVASNSRSYKPLWLLLAHPPHPPAPARDHLFRVKSAAVLNETQAALLRCPCGEEPRSPASRQWGTGTSS